MRRFAVGIAVAMLVAVPVGACLGEDGKMILKLSEGGKMILKLSEGGVDLGEIHPGMYGPDWSGFEERPEEGSPKKLSPDTWQYASRLLPEKQRGGIHCIVRARTVERGVELAYELRTEEELRLNSLYLRFEAPLASFAGREVDLPDRKLTLPGGGYAGDSALYYGSGTRVVFSLPERKLKLSLPEEMEIELEDGREWGDPLFALSFHFFHGDQERILPAGSVFRQSLFVESEEVEKVIFEPILRSRTDTSGWFPFDLPRDVPQEGEAGFEGAVDFSNSLDKPAGGHGFVKVEGGHFAFEDGTPAKFWGVALDSGACFPEKDQAPLIARRMAQLGINIVRFALDNASPIGLIVRGEDTREIDTELLDRLDHLVWCLKERGIYTRLDVMHYRHFNAGDGVDAPTIPGGGDEGASGGRTMYFQPRVRELHQEFAAKILLHENPYTELRYVDDPALAFFGIVNENSVFIAPEQITESGRRRLEGMYEQWLERHAGGKRLRFLAELERQYYQQMYAYLREIGVKAPIGCTNVIMNTAHGQLQALVGDHMEFNAYWAYPPGNGGWAWDRPMLKERGGIVGSSAAASVAGKPFAITEINYFDASYRSEAPLLTAAYASLQDWDCVLWWDYHGNWKEAGKYEMFLGTTSMFSLRENPMLMAQFGAASVAFRGGYISPGKTRVDVKLSDADVFAEPNWIWQESWSQLQANSPFAALPMMCRVRSRYEEAGAQRADLVIQTTAGEGGSESGEDASVISIENPLEAIKSDPELVWRRVWERMRELNLGEISEPGAAILRSDTGELSWNTEEGVLTIDAPRFQAAIGFVADKSFQLADFTIDLRADPASDGRPQAPFSAISLCSLDGQPLKHSSHILLTAVGRTEDTGQSREEDAEGRVSFTAGTPPVLAEPVRGHVTWKGRRLRAFSLSPSGRRLQEIMSEDQESGWTVTIGLASSLWYELVSVECED